MQSSYTPEQEAQLTEERQSRRLLERISGCKRDANGCLIWPWAKSPKGYPVARFRRSQWIVTRAIYTLEYGEIPAGMYVCHSCDNPACVNIQHLWAGTARDNTRDMIAKGRDRKRGLPGETNPSAKLSEPQVKQIIAMLESGTSSRAIAKETGVNRSTVRRIQEGIAWSYLERSTPVDPVRLAELRQKKLELKRKARTRQAETS